MTIAIGARIVASDGTTVVREFHDHAAGLDVLSPITLPRFAPRRARTDWMHSEGDVAYGPITRGTGLLVVNVLLERPTWAQVVALWADIEADLWAEPDYFVEVDIEGVRHRYLTDVPSFGDASDVEPYQVQNPHQTYGIAFVVQPNPTVTAIV